MKFADWMPSVERFVAENHENIVRDIRRVVEIPSVEDTPAPGAPYGAGARAALDEGLKIAQEMGLDTHNADGHIGWAEVKGRTDKTIATITHLDVVPAGNGWDADPFVMRRRDGWLIGRGVCDDKGPSILCLYIAKFLKEQGITPRYNFRVLLGCNEETGMGDVEYYLHNFPAPDFCFSPDAEFPVCNGEKGVYEADIFSPVLHGCIVDFAGGVASNAVPDLAHCIVKADAAALPAADRITVESAGEGLARIEARGKAGHAASPAGTVNAIGLIVDYLLDNALCEGEEKAYLESLRRLFSATDGSGVGVDSDDGLFDPLTIIGGTIRMEEGRLLQNVNSRFPTSTTGEAITAGLEAAFGPGCTVRADRASEPFYISADHPAIQTLLNVYNEVTGEDAKPFTMGGGTYARHFPLAVSFGPEASLGAMPADVPSFVGSIHGPNEGVSEEHLLKALKIYLLAVLALQDVDL